MSRINDIVKIQLNHTCKVIVGTDQDKFLARLLELGEGYLEDNRIFAVLFDVTQLQDIWDMKSYSEVTNHFPNSSRIPSEAFYIGNYDERDHMNIMDQMLKMCFIKYEIVEFIK